MMSHYQPAVDLGGPLRAAETLLDQAFTDLASRGREAPGQICATALAEAQTQLRAFAAMCSSHLPAPEERATLRKQLAGLVPRLQSVERLLAAAAEFYRGWCAVATLPVSGYESVGYGNVWCDRPRAALLAIEA